MAKTACGSRSPVFAIPSVVSLSLTAALTFVGMRYCLPTLDPPARRKFGRMQRRFKQGIAKSRPRLRASALALNVEARFGSSRLPAKVLQILQPSSSSRWTPSLQVPSHETGCCIRASRVRGPQAHQSVIVLNPQYPAFGSRVRPHIELSAEVGPGFNDIMLA